MVPYTAYSPYRVPPKNVDFCVFLGSSWLVLSWGWDCLQYHYICLPISFALLGCWRIWVLFVRHRKQCPKICTKLTRFEDYAGRKLPLKYYLIRCCNFYEMSKTMSQIIFVSKDESYFCMYNIIHDSPENSVVFTFVSKKLDD